MKAKKFILGALFSLALGLAVGTSFNVDSDLMSFEGIEAFAGSDGDGGSGKRYKIVEKGPDYIHCEGSGKHKCK